MAIKTILNTAATAAHQSILEQSPDTQRYSQFPVMESAFWESIFEAAKNPRKAKEVLKELAIIEAEPCIENERVWNNVRAAKSFAKLALLN